jgi:PIN domain nuclease of toxin-antitoxin system
LSSIVLDASAVLAILREESEVEALTVELLADSVIGAVNLAEVQTKLVRGDSLSLV